MKARKFFVAMAIMVGIGALSSCEKTSTAEQDEINEISIERDEIKEQDVV